MSRGWLANKKRKERVERPNTFTDKDCERLIRKIDNIKWYISSTLGSEMNKLAKLRDKALIATNWIFFSRGGEVLRLRRKDVNIYDNTLYVTFLISKKKKRFKYCPECETRNALKSNYCRNCKQDLTGVEPVAEGQEKVMTKRKTLKHSLTSHAAEWIKAYDEQSENPELYLFPPLRVYFRTAKFDFENCMTIQNFDRILQRLDPTMTSCLFRYGGSEKYLKLGYTPYELKEIGGWESSRMPEVYAERKGFTPAQRRWSEDIR